MMRSDLDQLVGQDGRGPQPQHQLHLLLRILDDDINRARRDLGRVVALLSGGQTRGDLELRHMRADDEGKISLHEKD